ncbi:MAG TPA: universal stress protein [Roseiarcus sp.]|nr:universal stress protein [Roseiarcus sp.]
MLRKMLVANDGSPGGERALKYALELARRLELGVTMICVEEIPRFPASIDEVAEAQADAESVFDRVIASAKTQAANAGVTLDAHVVPGHPLPSIVDFVKKNGHDVLVVGFMGHTALYNRLIGSTTDQLVEHAPCAVIVVK